MSDFKNEKMLLKEKEKKESFMVSEGRHGHSKSRGGINDGLVRLGLCLCPPLLDGLPTVAIFAAFFTLFF